MKKFKIEHQDLFWEMVVEIDPEKAAPAIREMVEFWSGWDHDLFMNDGDYTKTFLQSLSSQVLTIQIGDGYNLYGVLEELQRREGWAKFDGSQGIKILSCEDIRLDGDEFTVKEIK